MGTSKKFKFGEALASVGTANQDFVFQSIVEGDKPDYQYIRTDIIRLNPNNDYRAEDTDEDISDLAEDIKRNGLLHNIVLSYKENGDYILLSGEKRLRAYRKLYEETKDEKYSTIYSLIRKGLTDTEEMIILDAANLQARGATGDEKKFRKATIRFINNLKIRFEISEEEAVALTKRYAGASEKVIERNIVLETDLLPSLLLFLDEGIISKNNALEYAKLPEAMQYSIAENIRMARKEGEMEAKKASEALSEPIKEIKALRENIEKQEKLIQSTKEQLKEIKEMKKGADESTLKTLNAQENELRSEQRKAKRGLQSARDALAEKEDALMTEEDKEKSADIKKNAISAEIEQQIKAIERVTGQLNKFEIKEKAKLLDQEKKEEFLSKIRKLSIAIDDIYEGLKKQ